MGAAVRDHRNAVRNQSESLSAINRNTCPQSPESADHRDARVDGAENRAALCVINPIAQTAETFVRPAPAGDSSFSGRVDIDRAEVGDMFLPGLAVDAARLDKAYQESAGASRKRTNMA
jgi:hypothetical protein